ncbi:molybdopterin-dependent oxidoreductase [Geobacter sp. FeAm09]|uniref:molybdopterin-containing oxidoreductase family protein n=1 Tax=Geobacter sp. FeAm09 TaxID=2597769 RepID=UPI0011EFA5D4|nr:molybdopterin-dependent oxidoreductase [Geobacter sp. FeAm09]QEM67023.1 molybdopterin-dependent oxidoreductase [Geobacter sp. FeAm09]
MKETVKTNCRFCGYQCGLMATVDDGRVVAVEPDPTQYPGDATIQRGCHRWRLVPEFLDHPERVNHPLKRVGERGSGKWERITWDQALDEIAGKLALLKEQFGPETLASCIGGPHAVFWPLHRFMTLFGSPNNVGIGQICWNPGTLINSVTYGWTIDNELDPQFTKCAILWGVNQAESDNSLLWHQIMKFSRTGKPLVVIDPRRTRTAERATHWLAVRPGTDAVLAMGFINVIITERLYNTEFVDAWCHGFDRLANQAAPYTPQHVEAITGIKAEVVAEVARLYAGNTPSSLFPGRGVDQIGRNSVPTHHAFAALRAITGNLDAKGASHLTEMPDFIPELDLELSEQFPESLRAKQLGDLKLQSYATYDRIRQLTLKHGKRLPMRYLTSAQPNLVWRAMLTGKPYPIRSLIVMATNPLLTQADAGLLYEALKSLDLLVVLELFQTPTSMLADYVLPSAGALERPLFETKAGTSNLIYGGAKAVAPYYERRSDFDFWSALGRRLGQEAHWPWESFEESLEATLAPTGVSWDLFCQYGLYNLPEEYGKYEQIDFQSGKPAGFATTTGKVELYNELLAEIGGDPLPSPKPLEQPGEDFPLHLITGARYQPFYASSFRQFGSLRPLHPEPWAEVSSTTATKLGLEDGCRVWVETGRGKAQFVLKVSQMCDNVVSVEYGWWYPELPASEPSLGGLWLANANVLTNADYEASDPLVGTATYNGIPCRVLEI